MTESTRLPAVILISGRGSNMQAIAEQSAANRLPVDIRAVISDRPDAAGLTVANQLGLVTSALSAKGFADRSTYDAELAALVKSYGPRLVILAGFMRILTSNFIGAFTGRILNIHPSLLPKYRGLHTHRRAIEARDAVHGASVHFVTEELDGGPVIIQACVPVLASDTEATLSARVQRQEHTIYPQAIDWFARGRLELRGDQAWLDGRPQTTPVVLQS